MMRQQEIYRSSLSLNYLRFPADTVIMKKSVSPCSCCAVLLTWTLEMANFDILRTQHRNSPDRAQFDSGITRVKLTTFLIINQKVVPDLTQRKI